jgi:TonB family protein
MLATFLQSREAFVLQLRAADACDKIPLRVIFAFQMAETTPTPKGRANVSAGHLSVHVEGAHPADELFLFEEQQKRLGPALVVSLAYHVVAVVAILFAYRYSGDGVVPAVLPHQPNTNIIWLADPGPGGGGGGGGNEMKEPPRQAKLPGKDAITVPAIKPPQVEAPPKAKEPPPPIAQLNIPAQTLAAATESLPGAMEMPLGPPTVSQGSGTAGGAGTGTGTGTGPGTGSGLGPGYGGGAGGGAYRPGSGVTLPIKLREVKPAYTSDAMRAKVQGTVLLQCVVRVDGTVGDVEVIKSLDPVFGLDQEAIKAARQWLFKPGTRLGEAVPVLITIELTFTLR